MSDTTTESKDRKSDGARRRNETHQIPGEGLLAKVREVIHEGNVRRIIIKNEDSRTLVEIPVTVGVVGALLVPVWAAVGAIAAIVTNCSIEVEREQD